MEKAKYIHTFNAATVSGWANDAERRVYVNLNYPDVEGHINQVELSLCDVRAADSIRITYDKARDGWSVQQQRLIDMGGFSAIPDTGEDWKEVAFVPAWGREEKYKGAEHGGSAD